MLVIKVTPELIVDLLTEGREIKASIVKKGLPSKCKLINCRYNGCDKLVELWFSELEDTKELVIEIETKEVE